MAMKISTKGRYAFRVLIIWQSTIPANTPLGNIASGISEKIWKASLWCFSKAGIVSTQAARHKLAKDRTALQ